MSNEKEVQTKRSTNKRKWYEQSVGGMIIDGLSAAGKSAVAAGKSAVADARKLKHKQATPVIVNSKNSRKVVKKRKVHFTKNGARYVIRISKITGKKYKQYLR